MKKSFILLLLASFIGAQVNAQVIHIKTEEENVLSLAEAVSGYQFTPKRIYGFEWIKDHGKYSYSNNSRGLMVADLSGKEEEVLNIVELNSKLGTDFFYFANLKWRNENEFIINQGQTIATYNLKNTSGKVITLLDDAENITFNNQLEYVAYTKGNNLFISSVDVFKEHAITDYEDKNIVSGQSIARSEMGITQGIFWSPSGESIAFYQKDETRVADYPLLNIIPTPGKLMSIKYPMAGQDSERAKIGIFSIKSGETNYIDAKNGEDYYLTNLAWTPDDQFILLAEVARSQKHIWMQKYAASGRSEERRVGKESTSR